MNSKLQGLIESYEASVKNRRYYEHAVALMSWDVQTHIPKGAVEERSAAIGALSTELFKLSTSEELEQLLKELSEEENYKQLSLPLQRSVEEDKKQLERFRKIPPEKFGAYRSLTAKAQSVWQEAKAKNDFAMFQPYFEQIMTYLKEFVEYFGYEGHRYNALLDQYEPGMTVEQLDPLFQQLKEKTIPLLEKIKASTNGPKDEMLYQTYAVDKQREISIKILKDMGYDFDRGRLDLSAHPFTIELNGDDVRVTTRFEENSLTSALFSSIHEGGHGLYEQNIDKSLRSTVLAHGVSMGIHESQSRFWENFIGRSKAFWDYFGPTVKEVFPENLKDATIEEIYRGVNKVQPSLIRVEADELTYNLHIILRYELEKDLIDGKIEVKDLPRIWNEKMAQYLGVVPSQDGEGVLQDVHWADGLFGYFPSYSLGNIYAAQFTHTMKKALPQYEEYIRTGNFKPILQWLKENIHCHGGVYLPIDLVKRVTGEPLNIQYYVDYLTEKYTEIYDLK